MIDGMGRHLATTEAAVTACRAIAAEYAREVEMIHGIGADQTSRRGAAGAGVTTAPDGSLSHEASLEFGGLPRVTARTRSTSRCSSSARGRPAASGDGFT